MWPFGSSRKLKDSGLFTGFTDWHSHLLPGVDDGIRTMEDSLKTLALYEELGVKEVWLTPHIMEDCANTTQRLRDRYGELLKEYKGGIAVHLASENMLDALFEERLAANDFLPIGKEGRHLLVETSYVNPPYGMEEMIDGVLKLGYFPVLAHPERYRYMEEHDYRLWKEKGILFQCNFLSLLGGYGETAREKCEWLLSQDMIDMTGSDTHRFQILESALGKKPKKQALMDKLVEIAHKDPI